jgi:SAM domain (Sterile alpha motif)
MPPSLSTIQLNLVRLTLTPSYSPPLTPPKRSPPRKRKIPKYPLDATDDSALQKWLHTLRLHKYLKNLAGLTMRELLEVDEEELLRRGVDTLGARRKLLVVSRFLSRLSRGGREIESVRLTFRLVGRRLGRRRNL